MKKAIYNLAITACAAVMLHACDLDEYNPAAGDTSLQSFTAWAGLAVNCYSPLYSQMFSATDYLSVAEAGTDEWFVKANGTSDKEVFYYESLTTGTNATNKLFKQCYSMISACNSVINESINLVDGSQADIDILVGEAKCLRAYYYLVLVTHFGPVTLNLENTGKVDFTPSRASEEAIYTQIIEDLKDAAGRLGVKPYQNNYGRVSKKTALGLLARTYIQGAGLDLVEDGKSYWQRAKEVAVDLIDNAASYNAYLYPDISDMWADANNRNNKEALFIAAAPQAGADEAFNYASGANKLFAYTCGNPGALAEFWNNNHKPSDKGYFYGRMNSSLYMPSKYLMDCFNPSWDKRWENSFIYGYSEWSMVQAGWVKYTDGIVTITQDMCDKYKLNPKLVGEKFYPYADCNALPQTYGGNQYPAAVWPKGDHSGDISKLEHPKKVYVVDYPIAKDDDRFNIVCSKDYITPEEKLNYHHYVININDLYDENGLPYSVPFDKSETFAGTSSYQVYPSLNKFNWSYDGVFNGGNLQVKYGDMFIMRMAEVYLIAAEAEQHLGNGGAAAKYLNVLRGRAVRAGANQADIELTSATEDDIFDEYARELCGEFSRWALLKRHKAFESRLKKYNIRAFESFKPNIHYNRPISQDFLTQISNKEEYGDNGYGTTAKSGL